MKVLLINVLLLLVLLAGCASGEKQAADLLETARFEEKQGNLEHATQLYDEILKKCPSSAAAKDATARKAELLQRKP
jgi:Tetratricopeptide repeat